MKEIIDKFKEKEKLINDLEIQKRGLKIKLKRLSFVDGSNTSHDADPFNIDTQWENHQYGELKDFDSESTEYIIFVNEDYEYLNTNIEHLLNEDGKETFSDFTARITGDAILVGSTFFFEDYPQWKFEIGETNSIRTSSNIKIYKVVRV